MDRRPIGVMDSGLGGLSVLRVLRRELPDESLLFVGDQGHFPYGTKTQAEVRRLALAIGRFLVRHDAKLMVVACNTATGAALPALQAALPIPVIGVIRPGASAALATNPRTIGVIGTDSTIKNGAYERTLHELQPTVQVVSQPAQPLVSIVEHGQTGTPAAQQAVNKVLQCFATQPVETLILGCTHFPFLSREIQRRLGPSVRLIDPAYETVQTVKQVLTDKHLLAAGGQQRTALYTTGRIADLQAGADKWLAGDYEQCSSVKLDGE